MRIWPAAVIAAAIASGTTAAPAVASAPGSMHLGLLDSAVSYDLDPALRAQWLDRMTGVGADRIRISVNWSRIEPRAPQPGEDAADPAWPGYQWGALDTAVAEATARGLTAILTITAAPSGPRDPTAQPVRRRAPGALTLPPWAPSLARQRCATAPSATGRSGTSPT